MKRALLISLLLLGGCSSKDQSTESLTVTIDGKTVTKVTSEYGKNNIWKSYESVYEPLTASCKLAEFMRQSVSHSSTSSIGTVTGTSVTSKASLNLETTDFEAIARTKEAELNVPRGINYAAPSELIKLLISQYKMNQAATFLHTTLQYDENAKKFLKESAMFEVSPSSITCETQLDVTSKRPD